jgi:hypothetical protein
MIDSRTAANRKAAERRRTPKRKGEICGCNGGHVLECGSALPLSARRSFTG